MVIQGSIWEVVGNYQVLGFTANSTIRKDGALVMGRGMASQVLERYPGINYELGRKIKPIYHVAVVDVPNLRIAAIQVKKHYADNGCNYQWELTRDSLTVLGKSITKHGYRMIMNMPLIGFGGFRFQFDDVKYMVEKLLPMDLIDVYYK